MVSILITGAAGFIGSNLARFYHKKKWDVHALLHSDRNIWRINDLKGQLNIHSSDLLDFAGLKALMEKTRPDHIIHTATYGAYPRLELDENKIIETNVKGTFNLLNATKNLDYRSFVNVGSSSEYGIKNNPMKETDVLEPNTIYGIAKAAETMLCTNFAKSNKKNILTLRPFSIYGYYEHSFRLVPDVIINCLQNKDVQLTRGDQKRDFVFIEDFLEATEIAFAKAGAEGGIFNIGSGHDITIREMAETIRRITNSRSKLLLGKLDKTGFETAISWKADMKITNKHLGWEAKTDIEDGIKKTADWFRENMGLYKL